MNFWHRCHNFDSSIQPFQSGIYNGNELSSSFRDHPAFHRILIAARAVAICYKLNLWSYLIKSVLPVSLSNPKFKSMRPV